MGKKKIMKRALAVGVSALVLTSSMVGASAAAQSKQPNLKVSSSSNAQDKLSGGVRYSGRELSFYDYGTSGRSTYANLPDKYDLRDSGKVTPVKDQSPWGSCWAFGSLASGESSLLMQGASATPDLSELQLAWFAYQAQKSGSQEGEGVSVLSSACDILDQGGNPFKAISVLSSWQGAASESDIPYQNSEGTMDWDGDWSVPESERNNSVAHLQNAVFLPASDSPYTEEPYQYSPVTTEAIKKALMANGVVNVSYFADQSMPGEQGNGTYFNYNTWAQYVDEQILTGADNTIPNHAVAIVGWDDSYSRTNFNPGRQPEKDGAWIVKNSWGKAPEYPWGVEGSGYFYLSYYDQTISMPTSFVMDSNEGGFAYDNNYQYDYLGLASTLGVYIDGSSLPFANVFTSGDGYEQLKAVSAVTEIGNCTVDTKVYKLNENATSPTDGVLVSSVRDSFAYSGYYTIDLPSPVALAPNTRFSVVQTIVDEYGASHFPVEAGDTRGSAGMSRDGQVIPGAIRYTSVVNPGESFLFDGDTWFDMVEDPINLASSGFQTGNTMIKAFTSDVDVTIPKLQSLQVRSFDAMDNEIGEMQEISASADAVISLPAYTNYVTVNPVLTDGSKEAKFEINGQVIEANKPVSRKLFTSGSTLKVTTIPEPAGYADGLVYSFGVKAADDTVLTDKDSGVAMVDSAGYLPQGVSMKVEKVSEGADYDALKQAVNEKVKNEKFTVLNVTTEYNGAPLTLKEGENVTLRFPLPVDYNKDQIQLYRAAVEDGKVVLYAASEDENAALAMNTSYINSFYVLVQKEKEIVSSDPSQEPSSSSSNTNGPSDPSNSSQNNNGNQNSPSTGDSTPIVMLAVVLGASCVLVVLLRKKNRICSE